MKTPEQQAQAVRLAREWSSKHAHDEVEGALAFHSFMEGHDVGYQAAKDQLADADKVITYDYVETASNEAKELIAKFGLIDNEDVLVKALVAAYCRGVDAVDGYLRNSLSAYRASVKQQRWISVKDRLPEINEGFIGFAESKEVCNCYRYPDHSEDGRPIFYAQTKTGLLICGLESISHWMPLPEPPKEEK